MTDLKKLSMSELISMHNELADKLGVAQETSFKNLAAARTAVANLETKMENVTNDTTAEDVQDTRIDVPSDPAGSMPPVAANPDKAKYNSSGKRGPTQGVGEYAKQLITQGLDNATVLAEVMKKFPSAKTSKGCIAFYRTALSKTPTAPNPEALRQQAQVLLEKAAAAEAALAAKAEEDAKAAAEAPAEEATV